MGSALTTLDWIVIAGYFGLIVAVGLYVARKVTRTQDYFWGTAASASG